MAHPFTTVQASTKRSESLGSGRTGAPITHLSALAITPLWPLQQGTVRELAIESPREFKEAYTVPDGDVLPDVREGDVLVVGGREYPVWWVGEWGDLAGGVPCLHIIVQEVK